MSGSHLDTRPMDPSAAPLAQPSQDPRPEAQAPLTHEERKQEAKSVAAGGGMVAGAAGGAAVGTAVAGPAGTLVGALVGAVLGTVGGYAAVPADDPEYLYWKEHYQPPADEAPGYTYEEDYAPAYRLGYQGRQRYPERQWSDAQEVLQADWEQLRGSSRLSWAEANALARAAWERPVD